MQQKNICIQFNRYDDISFYKNNANILFLQECVLDPNNQIILDASGYDLYSNFVGSKLNLQQFSECENKNTAKHLFDLGFDFFIDNLTKNCINIYLDCETDETYLLECCASYLPKKSKIKIIGQKKSKDALKAYFDEYRSKFHDVELECDDITNETFKNCELLVIKNDNILYKAMAMGIKVVVMDYGLYSRTNAVLDCKINYKKLKNCLSFYNDKHAILNLFTSIYRYGIGKQAIPHELFYNTQFINWLSRMFA
jgi:hypothetical protein